MIDEEVKAVVSAIIIVALVFAVSQMFLAERIVEPFSEIGLLGPKKKIGDYPREVIVGEPIKLYLYLGNHEGKVMYYVILVKLGNRSTFVNSTIPADAPVIDVYERILAHNETCLIPVILRINRTGINLRLIFEMWIYDENLELKYHGRWLQLWINVTKPR